jgi:hypothetical protein
MSATEPKRQRKPKARATEIVFGCVAERLSILENVTDETLRPHVERIGELMDELRRSLNRNETEES